MKTLKLLSIIAALPFSLWFSVSALAQEIAPKAKMPSVDSSVQIIDGEVRKIDKPNNKITIKHGEIKNLDMPAMTMVFRVSDPGMLDRVKKGDKVKFRVKKDGGAFIITDIKSDK